MVGQLTESISTDFVVKPMDWDYSYVFCDCGTYKPGMNSTCVILCPDAFSANDIAERMRHYVKVTRKEWFDDDLKDYFKVFKPDMVIFVRLQTLNKYELVMTKLYKQMGLIEEPIPMYEYNLSNNPTWLNNELLRYYWHKEENDNFTIFERTDDRRI